MEDCKICDNYRFTIKNNKPIPCTECNSENKYPLKEITICLGCGRDIAKSDCSCPAGTSKSLLKQN